METDSVERDRLRNYLGILGELSRLASTSPDADQFLNQVVHEVSKAVDVERIKVLRYRPEHGDLLVVAGIGWREGVVGKATLPTGLNSPPGRAVQIGRVVVIDDLPASKEYRVSNLLADHQIVSLVNAPIAVEGMVWGVLEADSRDARCFSEDTVNFMAATAHMIGAAMQRKHAEMRTLEAEAETARTLGRREILLREMQHRVKNNFQVILSFLMLQQSRVNDDNTTQVLTTLANRITAIALAHDQLDPAQGLRSVNLASYLGALCRQLREYAEGVSIESDLEGDEVPIDMAVALGLIVNELVTNALKHAFDGQQGMVVVEYRAGAGIQESCLSVIDDGKGMVSNPRPGSMGTSLVQSIVTQLRGRLSYDKPPRGTAIKIYFPPMGSVEH